jgi:NAD(P)-dependent dehydrogenase (short-subunit alcohol dehydrogenase family)
MIEQFLTGSMKGTGIARILSSTHGNLAVALLARRPESLQSVISKVREANPEAVLEAFPSDTSKASLEKAFADIKAHESFKDLKLKLAIYSIKHSSKKPFLEETREDFEKSLETYVGGAFTFAQESLKRFFADHGEKGLQDGGEKKGVSNDFQLALHLLSLMHSDFDLHWHSWCPSVQRSVCRLWRWTCLRSSTSANLSSRDERKGCACSAHHWQWRDCG